MKNTLSQMRNHASSIFYAGLEAVNPADAVKSSCVFNGQELVCGDQSYNLGQYQNIIILGAGKATAPMAQAIEKMLGSIITRGLVNVKYEHLATLNWIEINEAGHPVPDASGMQGAQKAFELAASASAKDLVICLISGGASALWPLPVAGITLQDKQKTTEILLSCGATINEINIIRKHLSLIKGGRLAQIASPATLICLILSDVVGDDLDVIASGPTVPDSSTFGDCITVIEKYNLQDQLPLSVFEYLTAGLHDKTKETPKKNSPVFKKVNNIIIGNNLAAIKAAEKTATQLGYNTLILSSMIEGETRVVAGVHTAIAKEIIKSGHPISRPACILSGGETTVTIRGKGKGGRNQEFVLAALPDIAGRDHTVILSAGTDGTDGPTDAAGAFVDSKSFQKACQKGLCPDKALGQNDSYTFFKELDDLLITGPTNTNVMDLRIILVN